MVKIKHITYLYVFVLVLGTLIPLGTLNYTLNDNYTMHIRWDYLIHAFVYLPMIVLLGFGFRSDSRVIDKNGSLPTKYWIVIILVGLFLAALFEALQLLIPYRRFNINDLIANSLGVILGVSLVPIFGRVVSRFQIR